MIIEALINLIWIPLRFVIGLLPEIGIGLPTGFFEWFTSIVQASAYFLPLVDFFAMLLIWFIVVNFQIIWKTIQRIWDSLPFV